MTEPLEFDYDNCSRIKDVYIELPQFERFHRKKNDKNELIGRKKLLNRLKEQIGNEDLVTRTILVTGFRGVGKTALVKEAIKGSKVKPIYTSLAQENLSYKDVLRSMVGGLIDHLKEKKEKPAITRVLDICLIILVSLFVLVFSIDILISETTFWIENIAFFDWIKNNYGFTIELILFIAVCLGVIRLFVFSFQSSNLLEAKKLELRIDAAINREKGRNFQTSASNFLSYNRFKKSTYSNAIPNDKEIELEFLRILKKLKSPPIFVLDELDKIEARSNAGISDKADEEPNYTESEGSIYTTHAIRQRQEAIASILANMKNFLNEAPAKFIFIAGREMYDASLADVAARDSFYGSIFHDIIYVPSLIKSDTNKNPYSGISKPTELFLFRLLFPDNIERGDNSEMKDSENLLSRYYELLKTETVNKDCVLGGKDNEEATRKIIYILQTFVFYLIYRSNGMPKKIIQLIEEHVKKISFNELNSDQNYSRRNVVAITSEGKTEKGYFLKLDYKTQHKIGFITYLYRPYLIAHGRSSKFRSDKLLVSTSFLVDHILKFHNQGFSWRNLELTPEILAINKEPELRRFITNLLESLFKTHIRRIENGIHQYKFYSRLEHEIRFLSRISPADSAAFNFTLDESILIKKHYKSKINQLRKNYTQEASLQNVHIDSIAFINNLLGDLHFFDKEYDDALVNYNDTIQSLKRVKIENLTLKHFTLYCLVRLKMGHTYERIKAFNSSLSNYLELQNDILIFSERIKSKGLKKNKNKNISRQIQNEIRAIGQGFLSSLVAIEKSALDGLTSKHLINNYKTFKVWIKTFDTDGDKGFQFLKANFFLNRGSILFFKNGNIHLQSDLKNENKKQKNKFTLYTNWDNQLIKQRKMRLVNYRPSISALKDYTESLHWYLLVFKQTGNNKKDKLSFSHIINLINRKGYKNSKYSYSGMGTPFIISLAGVLSKLADCLLTLQDGRKIKESDLRMFFWINSSERELSLQECFDQHLIYNVNDEKLLSVVEIKRNFDVPKIVVLYEVIAKLYESVGKDINASFQRRKILYTLNVLDFPSRLSKKLQSQISSKVSSLFKKILRGFYQAHENTIRPQILKYELIFCRDKIYDTNRVDSKSLYNNISTSIEAKETEILTNDLIRKFSSSSNDDNYESSPFGHTPSVYVRYLELRSHFKKNASELKKDVLNNETFNKEFWSKNRLKAHYQKFCFYRSKNSQLNKKNDFIVQKTCDTIFTINTAINLFGVHGQSAIFGHSLLAESHWNMAIWCQVLKVELTITDGNKFFNGSKYDTYKVILEDLIGAGIMHRLDPKQHLEKAKEHYQKAIAMHCEGDSYRQLIDKMYYLEDDFTDNFSHFSLAVERFYINTGTIYDRLEIINDCLEDSRLYKLSSYI
ncbi:MAG: hypothetical protein GQ574_26630 [Crocinitomix sp.]|nr:hypothetical protein [Crocinitomix sp.]